jgi:hypothetical protein
VLIVFSINPGLLMHRRDWRRILIVALAVWFGTAGTVAAASTSVMQRSLASGSTIVDDVLGVVAICLSGHTSDTDEKPNSTVHPCVICAFADARLTIVAAPACAGPSMASVGTICGLRLEFEVSKASPDHAPIRGPPAVA